MKSGGNLVFLGRAGKEIAGDLFDGEAVVTEFRLSVRSPKTELPRARYVRVELPGPQRILSLAEVQVFNGGENIAARGTARQSSTDGGAEAGRAIDGKTDGDLAAGSTTLTKAEESPWWELDLGEELTLEELALWNRTDVGLGTRLADFKVLALDAQRKTVWEKNVGPPPNPVAYLRLPAEKEIKLQNASADFSEKDYDAAKAIDRRRRWRRSMSV